MSDSLPEDLHYLDALSAPTRRKLRFTVPRKSKSILIGMRSVEKWDRIVAEPLGPVFFRLFLNSIHMQHYWVLLDDITHYKELPHGSYKKSTANKIMAKYFTPSSKSFMSIPAIFLNKLKKDLEMGIFDESKLFDTILELIERDVEIALFPRFMTSEMYSRLLDFRIYERRRYKRKDFEFIRVLGEGGFGRVIAVIKKDTRKNYACKLISKDTVIKRNRSLYLMNERNILAQIDHPFIVSLYYAFQDNKSLYLIMDLVTGGEIRYHLKRSGLFSEEWTRFYIAEIVLALQHLHDHDIVYRDLKPENVLLASSGHICLTDLGLCAYLKSGSKLREHCGTRSYMAPEQSYGTYGKEVDWWSLGILMYVMIYGKNPFKRRKKKHTGSKGSKSIFSLTGRSLLKLGASIRSASVSPRRSGMKGSSPIGSPKLPSLQRAHSPEMKKEKEREMRKLELMSFYSERHQNMRFSAEIVVSNEAKSLMKDFLVLDPSKRLGANGIEEIKTHVFFKGLNWTKLEKQHIPPPFIPDIQKVHADVHSGAQKEQNKPRKAHYFENFDFIRKNAFQLEISESLYDASFLM